MPITYTYNKPSFIEINRINTIEVAKIKFEKDFVHFPPDAHEAHGSRPISQLPYSIYTDVRRCIILNNIMDSVFNPARENKNKKPIHFDEWKKCKKQKYNNNKGSNTTNFKKYRQLQPRQRGTNYTLS